MSRVYLETSFVSACVTLRTDPASVYRRQASLEWWDSERARHGLFMSAEVVAELSDPQYPRREDALAFIAPVELLPVTEDVLGFAQILVREKVMPGPLKGDAVHVAVAVVHGMEYVLSWNVRHLANLNKAEHLARVCMRAGLLSPRIVTPEFLWEEER